MNVLVLLTDFSHHGEHSGYKQILQFIQPAFVLGVNERKGIHTTGLRSKYQWIFEWDIWKHRKEADLIHIMYAEDYLRFSPLLYPDIPIVATFHQPAESLEREIASGDMKGRMGKITHRLSKNRFGKLAAAIVTEAGQKKVLSRVMPSEKIHIIPLGVHLSGFRETFDSLKKSSEPMVPCRVVTVGHWLRDWDFYFRVIDRCADLMTGWEFVIINRRLEGNLLEKINQRQNVKWIKDASSEELKKILYTSAVHFLPVTAASGNNAVIESLAMGCPVVMTDVFNSSFHIGAPAVTLYKKNSLEEAITYLENFVNLNADARKRVKEATFASSAAFDWSEIARKTQEVYNQVLNK
ncbi:MAG: glycosyltransferase [Crocinitomicaceae bacterium]|nr:glycosyltransferase [Crocinitomicaceae bacterium]